MTGQQRQQLVNFLGANLTYGFSGWPLLRTVPEPVSWHQWTSLSTSTQFADYVMSSSQFRPIGLGGISGVIESALIEDAVATVVSRANPAFTLIVDGLKIAAERQRGESWAQIAKSSAVGLGVALTLFLAAKYGGAG